MSIRVLGSLLCGGLSSLYAYSLMHSAENLLMAFDLSCNQTCTKMAVLFERAITQTQKATPGVQHLCSTMCGTEEGRREIVNLIVNDSNLLWYKYYTWGNLATTFATVCFLYSAYHFCCSAPKEKTN